MDKFLDFGWFLKLHVSYTLYKYIISNDKYITS